MPITPEQIDEWRAARSETQILEFKAASSSFAYDKLCEYCVAIANEGGGHLVLGISNDPPRPVNGTQAINDPVGMMEKLWEDLRFRVDIEEIAHPDGRVVVCKTPSRPKCSAYHYKGRFLMRVGTQTTSMSDEQLRKIYSEDRPDWLEEHAYTNASEQDVVNMLDTQAFFELIHRPYPSERAGVIAKLKEERLIEEDEGGIHIRRLAALLLAKKLQSFPELSRKAPRVVVYNGISKISTKQDQVGSMGYAVGFASLVNYVMGHLPQNEVIQDALRKEVKLLPIIVIRELVANALVHQDFSQTGTSVMIEIFDNRVEISNPGTPVVEVNRFIDGYRSRNERLAHLMRRYGICEEHGSGIDKVVSAAETYQLPAPLFRAAHERTEMIIYGPKEFERMDRDDRIRACYQHCVLKFIMNERMVNQTLRERFHLKNTESNLVSVVISGAQEEGLIKQDQTASKAASRKYAKYVPYWA